MAPRKITVVASLVRGKPVGQAISILQFTKRAAALPLRKLIESAMANATDVSKGSVDIDKLIVKMIWVDQGPTARRFMPRAMGRATRVNKKTSHLHVVLTDTVAKKQ
jgi:large subunit ribosomal protein L22